MTTYGFSRELTPRRKIDTPVSEVVAILEVYKGLSLNCIYCMHCIHASWKLNRCISLTCSTLHWITSSVNASKYRKHCKFWHAYQFPDQQRLALDCSADDRGRGLCLAGGSVGHDLGTGDMGTQMVATRSHRPHLAGEIMPETWLSLMYKVCKYIKWF